LIDESLSDRRLSDGLIGIGIPGLMSLPNGKEIVMGNISREIVGTKEGILEHLEERRLEALANSETSNTQRRRHYERGYSEGIWFAMRVIEDWNLEKSLNDKLDYGENDHGHIDYPDSDGVLDYEDEEH
jgi:hypothetical protein